MTANLFFYTEASHAVGMGHFMRCFALAEEGRDQDLNSHFFMKEITDPLCNQLQSIRAVWTVSDSNLEKTSLAHIVFKQDWWVIDSYHAKEQFISKLRKNCNVLVIDDLCALKFYDCDLILNASPRSISLPYNSKCGDSRLLLGAAFSLVRKEFQQDQLLNISQSSTGRVGIMLGGSDSNGLTEKVLRELHFALPDHEFLIFLGELAQNKEKIKELSHHLGRTEVHVNPSSLAKLLAATDLVVTAAGGSIGELCALGKMAVALVVVDNQIAALTDCPYPTLDCRQGLSPDLISTTKQALLLSKENNQIIQNARELVDGNGCKRVLESMFGAG
jgi:UDP-2,4-diacetamido-2,4,6-trideoxy-beta-L-altropyranose hydrolase